MKGAGQQAGTVATGIKRGAGVAVAGAAILLVPSAPPLEAKAPGVSHCYRSVCHRVRSIEQTRRLVGRTAVVETSYYDIPGVDRFNTGVFTSNGERFNAGDPARVASADLPDGTELLVRNPINGRVSHVRVNDFGPFLGNRRLDVTRRVAEDLDFKHKGVVKLEVTVIAPPQDDDLRYRRNRPPRSTSGHLGVVFDAEVPELVARLIAQRATPDAAPPADVVVFAEAEVPTSADRPVARSVPLADLVSPASVPVAAAAEATAASVAASGGAAAHVSDAGDVQSDVGGLTVAAAGAVAADLRPSVDLPVPIEAQARLVIAQADLTAAEEIFSGDAEPSHTSGSSNEVLGETRGLPWWGVGLAQAGPAEAEGGTVLAEPLIGIISASIAGTGLGITAASVAQLLPLPQYYLVLVLLLLSSALLVSRVTGTRAVSYSGPAVARSAPRSHGNTRVAAGNASARVSNEERSAPRQLSQGSTAAKPAPEPASSVRTEPQLPVSVISPEMSIEGTVKSSGRLVVSGVIRGRVEAGEIILTSTGSIEGEVFARTAEICGKLRGRLDAEAVTFAAGATFDGDVVANTIAADFEASVEGNLFRRKA